MIGSARVARATPDGYQFVLGNIGTHAQNRNDPYKNPLYNAAADFAPVALIQRTAVRAFVARNDLPVENLRKFIAYAKTQQLLGPALRVELERARRTI